MSGSTAGRADPVGEPVPPVVASMLARRSQSTLVAPGPDARQLDLILRAATTVPDHGSLRPWRFAVVRPAGRERFGDALADSVREATPAASPDLVDKARRKAFVAPCQVVVIASPVVPSKIPVWEQVASASCTGFAMVLAADDLGLGAMWKSAGVLDGAALRDLFDLGPDEQLLGWVNLGHRGEGGRTDRPEADLAPLVQVVDGDATSPYRPSAP